MRALLAPMAICGLLATSCRAVLPASETIRFTCENDQQCAGTTRCSDGYCVAIGVDAGSGNGDHPGLDRAVTGDRAGDDRLTRDVVATDGASRDLQNAEASRHDVPGLDLAPIDVSSGDHSQLDGSADRGNADRVQPPDTAAPDVWRDTGSVACAPATSFSDDFGSVTFSEDNWQIETEQDCSASFNGSDAQTYVNGDSAATCGFRSLACFDLTNGDIVFRISAITYHFAPLRAFVRAVAASGHTLELAFQDDHFEYGLVGSTTQVAYSDSSSYWKMSGLGDGFVYFYWSANGTAWTLLGRFQLAFPVDDVHVYFGVSTSGTMSNGVGIGFSSYNVLP